MKQLRACRHVRCRSRARTFGRRIKSRRAPRHACPLAVCEDGGGRSVWGTVRGGWRRDGVRTVGTRPGRCPSVCKYGLFRAFFAGLMSDFAHVVTLRVRKRTCGRGKRWACVRFCTPGCAACAETDMWACETAGLCPPLHTSPRCVCGSGHVSAKRGRFVSVSAHIVDRCVQNRTPSMPHGCPDGRLCTRQGLVWHEECTRRVAAATPRVRTVGTPPGRKEYTTSFVGCHCSSCVRLACKGRVRGQSDRGLSEWEYVSKRILHHERGTFTESGRRGAGISLRPLLTYRAAAGHSVGLVWRGPQGRRDHASLTRITAGPSWHGPGRVRFCDREPSDPPRQSTVSKMARPRSLRAWRGAPSGGRGSSRLRRAARRAPRDLGR